MARRTLNLGEQSQAPQGERVMKSISRPIIALLSIWMGLCLAGGAFAQSLADLAREAPAKKKMEPPKSGKVYTNSDIPAPAMAGTPPPEPAAQPPADQN